jgi:hypothetical protein
MVTLRFHPLVQFWAQDRLSDEAKAKYRAAAVRLFVCGITKEDDHSIREYLEPHLASISATSHDLHINDQAAISIFSRNKFLNLVAVLVPIETPRLLDQEYTIYVGLDDSWRQ